MRNLVVGVLVGILVLWAATVPVLILWEGDVAKRGQIGDAFGSINALFSGLALAGVIVAILLQREELRLQRKELEATRTELRRQADAAEKQERVLEAQRRATLLSAIIAGTAGISGAEVSPTKPLAASEALAQLAGLINSARKELGLPNLDSPRDLGVR